MNIFVGNLTTAITPEDLRRHFAGYGTTINAIVMRDTGTGLPLGYGHVYLVPEDAALAAIANLHNSILNHTRLIVRECVYRSRQERRLSRRPWKGIERRVGNARRHNGYHHTEADESRKQRRG
ncbi:MAG TPA: RNA-binding protein [Candidatus Methylomirabilis sp.]|nr:RNA-binding protein [Candidatus Methylomirabilis sp.]